MPVTGMQQLQELDYSQKIAKYTNVPVHAIQRARFNDRTANGLAQCIIRWLELKGHYCTRITTTGRKLNDITIIDVIGRAHVTPGKWIPGTTKRGTSDIIASINGRHASIELKIGRDVMSPAQIKTKQQVEGSGGLYFIAKDFESFYKWYQFQV